MSFLSVFRNILHAAEAAATIAAPIVKALAPTEAALMTFAVNAAVGVEGVITAPGQGAQRAALVQQQTQAVFDFANALLVAEGKHPLPQAAVDATTQQVATVVGGLNAIQQAVQSAPPA